MSSATAPVSASPAAVPPTGTHPRLATRSRLAAALIDLDGTMVDTLDDFTASLNGMLAWLNARATTREEVARYIGKGSEHLIRCVLTPRLDARTAHAHFNAALARYQYEYAQNNGHHTQLYPDVEAGLAALRTAGLALACVTNKPHRFAVALLDQYRLLDYFAVVLGGDSTPRKKPDPLPLQIACERLGVAPAATVAIGDSENDARAGRAAGMATLTVPYGYNHGQPVQRIESDGIVATLREAATVVIAHNGATGQPADGARPIT